MPFYTVSWRVSELSTHWLFINSQLMGLPPFLTSFPHTLTMLPGITSQMSFLPPSPCLGVYFWGSPTNTTLLWIQKRERDLTNYQKMASTSWPFEVCFQTGTRWKSKISGATAGLLNRYPHFNKIPQGSVWTPRFKRSCSMSPFDREGEKNRNKLCPHDYDCHLNRVSHLKAPKGMFHHL